MKKGFSLSLIKLLTVIGVSGIVMLNILSEHAEAASCGERWFQRSCSSALNQQQTEQENTTETLNRLENSTPAPHLEQSLERINIKRRLELFSDEAKVSYIYLVSYGKVMAFYTVKGKISSAGKRLTSQERLVNGVVMESPELDGTYGQSSPYIFFWTTDGAYVQWNGEYMLSDQPLKLTTQPELIRQIK